MFEKVGSFEGYAQPRKIYALPMVSANSCTDSSFPEMWMKLGSRNMDRIRGPRV